MEGVGGERGRGAQVQGRIIDTAAPVACGGGSPSVSLSLSLFILSRSLSPCRTHARSRESCEMIGILRPVLWVTFPLFCGAQASRGASGPLPHKKIPDL